METPTLRQLEYAVAVADHGHFGHAAAACRVSQPALSSQIAALEQRLGLVLFERGRHGAVVTPEGAAVISRARVVITQMSELVETADSRRNDVVGSLNIGVIPTMAPYLLPSMVSAVRRLYPKARVLLREERTDRLLVALADGAIDLGLLAGPVERADFDVVELAEDPFLLALPADHRLAGGGRLRPEDFAELPMLLLEDGHCLRSQAIDACVALGIEADGQIQATGLSSLCQMVAAGMGSTLLPASAIEVEARPGTGVAVRSLGRAAPSRTVVLAWRRTSPRRTHFQQIAERIAAPIAATCRVA